MGFELGTFAITLRKDVMAKNYCPVSLLSMISKVFENFVSNRPVDHNEKCGLLSNFQYGFRSSQSTVDHLIELLQLLIGLGAN